MLLRTWLGCCVVMVVLACEGARAEDARERIERGKAATAFIQLPGERASATAFCISASGLFVTNHHVVGGQPPDQPLTLILNPNSRERHEVEVHVVRLNKDADLAILKATGDAKDFVFLPLGDDERLYETMPVTSYGFPFGKGLAGKGTDYPDISVNVGRVTALRKQEGKLQQVQLDASLNPGNSGGPICNEAGEVIAIVRAGLLATGVNFGIPVRRLKSLLLTPQLTFTPPAIAAGKQHAEVQMTIDVEPFDQPLKDLVIELEVTNSGQPARKIVARPTTESKYSVTFVPVPASSGAGTMWMEGTLLLSRGVVQGRFANQKLKIGDQALDLKDIRVLNWAGDVVAVLQDGERVAGKLTGLEQLRIDLGEQELKLAPAGAKRLELKSARDAAGEIKYVLRARKGEEELVRQEGVLALSERGVGEVASLPGQSGLPLPVIPRAAAPPPAGEVEELSSEKLPRITLPKSMAVEGTASGEKTESKGLKFWPLEITGKSLAGEAYWSPQGDALFMLVKNGGVLRRFNRMNGGLIETRQLTIARPVGGMAISASGVLVAVTDLKEVWVINADSLEVENRIWAPDVERVVSGPKLGFALALEREQSSEKLAGDRTVVYLDLEGGTAVQRQQNLPVRNGQLTPDGKRFFVEGTEGQLLSYRLDGPKLVPDQATEKITRRAQAICISPNSKYVCLASEDGNYGGSGGTFVYSTEDLKKPAFTLPQSGGARCVGFAADGARIFSHNRGAPLIMYSGAGVQQWEFKQQLAIGNDVNQLAVHPSGKQVLMVFGGGMMLADVPPAP